MHNYGCYCVVVICVCLEHSLCKLMPGSIRCRPASSCLDLCYYCSYRQWLGVYRLMVVSYGCGACRVLGGSVGYSVHVMHLTVRRTRVVDRCHCKRHVITDQACE